MGAPKPAREGQSQEAPAPKILALFARGQRGPESRTAFGVHILGGRKGAYTSQHIYGELGAGPPFGVSAGSLVQKATGPVIPNTEQRAACLATVRAVWWAASQPETPSTVALCIQSQYWAMPDVNAILEKAFLDEPDLAEAYDAALDVLDGRAIRLVLVATAPQSEEGILQRLQKYADEVFSNPRGNTIFLTDTVPLTDAVSR